MEGKRLRMVRRGEVELRAWHCHSFRPAPPFSGPGRKGDAGAISDRSSGGAPLGLRPAAAESGAVESLRQRVKVCRMQMYKVGFLNEMYQEGYDVSAPSSLLLFERQI